MENELLKEMENGRLYRLLVKLGSINEREWVSLTLQSCTARWMLMRKAHFFFVDWTWTLHGQRQAIDTCSNCFVIICEFEVEMRSRWRWPLTPVCFSHCSFHSVTEDGNPWLDMSHIVSTLNKLDAGTMEKVSRSISLDSVLALHYLCFLVLGTTYEPRWAICFSFNICRVETMLVRSF